MLPPFEIHEPGTVDEASRLLAHYGEEAAVYAGGTELIPIMKEGLARFRHLVNIKVIPGLEAIAGEDRVLRVGAAATHRQIERSPAVRRHLPLLAEVAAQVANLRVRNAGTLGGNLCFAEPHSDPAAVLVASEASLILARSGTQRRVAADRFFLGILQTARQSDEVLVAVEAPAAGPQAGAAYRRFATHERPTAGVAVALIVAGGAIAGARVAVGSVGPIPARVPEAEGLLHGRPPEARTFRAAADAVGRSVEVLEDLYGSVEYKRHILAVLTRQALEEAAARAGGGTA